MNVLTFHFFCSSNSPPSSPDDLPNHAIIDGLIDKMSSSVSKLSDQWRRRSKQLEQSKKIVEFEEQIPEVFGA